ncbi:MAG: hypothetical protein OEV49_01235 [candidate division Zixibacteria bacterium]|nr:hypothetical protein [candidate division Zixibacteria bacterium]MDH3937186.1 hypothetical protein [candidate division Zixibacteria bacterium]MDH4032449.1 hypothetical protein [candidate division Zixibacteria bacterium]
MLRFAQTAMLVALILPLFSSSVNGEIVRVARRYNVISFFAGSSSPVGKYEGIAGFVDFLDEQGRLVEVDGDKVYDPTYNLGLSYGQLRNNQMLLDVGFRYTRIEQAGDNPLIFFGPDDQTAEAKLHQYDLEIAFYYLFMNIVEKSFAPFVGVGVRAGFTNASASGFESESHINTVFMASGGAELKLWEGAKKQSFMTLASVNSYDLFASGNRPKYLNVGAALKYYFRP